MTERHALSFRWAHLTSFILEVSTPCLRDRGYPAALVSPAGLVTVDDACDSFCGLGECDNAKP